MRTVLLLAPLALVACLPPAVTLSQNYALAPRPNVTDAVTGDFNGDGKVDLLVHSVDARGELTVMLGLGNGQFADGISTAIARDVKVPTIADLNNDNFADVLVIDQTPYPGTPTITVLIGNGDGTFRQPVSITIGASPTGARVADFNGDGKKDIAIAAGRVGPSVVGTGRLLVMLGHGDGTFDAPHTQELGIDPAHITEADFNGDGRMDLAVVDGVQHGATMILLGRGDGWFDEGFRFYAKFEAMGIRHADMNGDKLEDLVLSSNDGISVYLNLGGGQFGFRTAVYTDTFRASAIADFDHDGIMDFAVSRRYLHGQPDGTYRPFEIAHRDYDDSFTVSADLNNDGWPDLISTDRAHQEIRIALNRGAK